MITVLPLPIVLPNLRSPVPAATVAPVIPASHCKNPLRDGENVVGRVEDLMSDTSKLKQYATKKKPTMKEIVESSKKKKAVQKVHENESDYIVDKQGDYVDYDDYLPDIDDID